MMKKKTRLLVVCPGRGTYNKEELGYLSRYHKGSTLVAQVDEYRRQLGVKTVSQLDSQKSYSFKLHTAGEHASSLIYACALADFMAIDTDKYEIVAVTGNSMGWYIALAAAGALSGSDGTQLVDTMGSMMKQGLIGGQLIYPVMHDNWRLNHEEKARLLALVKEINERQGHALFLSIDLGGYLVLAGNETGLAAFEVDVPVIDERFPLRLYNHGAFHSPLLRDIAQQGQDALSHLHWGKPEIPLVDGRGGIWTPWSTDEKALFDYTLDHQVVQPYDFTRAIMTGLKEFSPDQVAILGPGATLGGAVAQAMIAIQWQGLDSKAEFQARQAQAPVLLSMGIEAQRQLLL